MSACEQTLAARQLDVLGLIEFLIGYSDFGERGQGGQLHVPVEALHQALDEARQRFPDLLSFISFAPHSLRPQCLGIERALASLGAAGMVSIENPHYRWLSVRNDRRAAFRDHVEFIPQEQREQLRQVAEIFDETARRLARQMDGER